MLNKWFKAPVHLYIRLIALSVLAIGVSTSNAFMSIATLLLFVNWLIEGQFAEKWERLLDEKIGWVFIFLFAFAALSLIWSENIAYGIHDLRVKLPLIVIPLVLSTSSAIEKKHFYFILYIFLATILFTSIWNYFQFQSHINEAVDLRQMSRFISHVRFSILVNMGIFFLYYMWLKGKWSPLLIWPIIIWLMFYQYKSQVVNGYGLFIILSILSLIYWIKHLENKILKRVLGLGLVGITLTMLIGLFYFWQKAPIVVPKVDYSKLELYTANHNGYYHQKNTKISEDGKLVYLYISEKECRKAWKMRSKVHFDSLDRKGHPIEGTIYRYMTSMGLRKDSVGFTKLDDSDIRNIEKGFSSYRFDRGIVEKIQDLKMQLFLLRSNGDPNGNSIIQRQLHLLAAGSILKEHWLTGVGVGDVQLAFDKEYEKEHSLLKIENRHRSHNQFMTIWISHGVAGFIAVLLLWALPFFKYLKTCDYLLCVVLIAFGFSFLWQDMLETQAGVTIFALFYSLTVFKSRKDVSNR
ncbi:MAG: O-antigen ligase family protein [Crocinitomicaceae bacterium]